MAEEAKNEPSDLENPKKAVFRILPLFLLTIVLCLAVIYLPQSKSVSQMAAGSLGVSASAIVEEGESLIYPFKVSFEGVNTCLADQSVNVLVRQVETGEQESYPGVLLSCDDQGIFSGFIKVLGVSSVKDLDVYVKGPKHLARKYLSDNNYPSVLLLVGDLPDPDQKNTQDGVANSFDFSLVKSRIGKNDAKSLAVADVNFDLMVDQTDLALVSQAVKDQLVDEP